MIHELDHPMQEVYWIAVNSEAIHFGITSPGQVTSSGMTDFLYDSNLTQLLNQFLERYPALSNRNLSKDSWDKGSLRDSLRLQ